MLCRRFVITGRVQGVFFRASTQEKARLLEITGYANNLSDGSVEVLACGGEQALEQLHNWLWQGPPAAKVLDISVSDAALLHTDTFTTA